MPHSSGGGSSGGGGGYHSGSDGPRGPRCSSRPFAGGTPYVYYDRHLHPHMCYCSEDPTKASPRSRIASYIFLGIFAIAPLAVVIFTGFHNPKKLATDYVANIKIEDRIDTLTAEEEATVQATFQEFYNVTGIAPYLVTMENDAWKASYASLQDYAYRYYVGEFGNDESHWLIAYSGDAGLPRVNWRFEGMQGNNTDNILTTRVTDRFNEAMYKGLSDSAYTVSRAVDEAFKGILPGIMDSSFYVPTPVLIFVIAWAAISSGALIYNVIQGSRAKYMKNAVKAPEGTTLKTCAHCGAQYYDGTVSRCPKCGNAVPDSRFASFGHDR